MTKYFFDSYDNDKLIQDEVGLEFFDITQAEREAARGLAELALDVLPGAERRTLSSQVRTADGPVFGTRLIFEMVRMAGEPDPYGRELSEARH